MLAAHKFGLGPACLRGWRQHVSLRIWWIVPHWVLWKTNHPRLPATGYTDRYWRIPPLPASKGTKKLRYNIIFCNLWCAETLIFIPKMKSCIMRAHARQHTLMEQSAGFALDLNTFSVDWVLLHNHITLLQKTTTVWRTLSTGPRNCE
jgi:hypothetical protein